MVFNSCGLRSGLSMHIAIDQPEGLDSGDRRRRHPAGRVTSAEPLEHDLAREVVVGAFVERHDDVGKTVQRDRTHQAHVRHAIHLDSMGKRNQALDFLGGMAGPLRDNFDHGRERSG